jgi:hypothetical protein
MMVMRWWVVGGFRELSKQFLQFYFSQTLTAWTATKSMQLSRRDFERASLNPPSEQEILDKLHAESCLLALALQWAVNREKNGVETGLPFRYFEQAHIDWTKLCHRIGVHLQQPHYFFVHTHVPELIINEFPKLQLALCLCFPNPVVDLTDNRSTGGLPFEQANELAALVVRFRTEDELQVTA